MGCYDSGVLKPLLSSSTDNGNHSYENNNKNGKSSRRFQRMVEEYEDVDGVSVNYRKSSKRLHWCFSSFGCFSLAIMFKKIWLLLWKNMLFRKRHYIVTLMEVLLPTLFACLMAYARSQTGDVNGSQSSTNKTIVFPEISQAGLDTLMEFQISCESCIVAYAPQNPTTENVIGSLQARLPGTKIDFRGFATEKEIEFTVAQLGFKDIAGGTIKAAIIFPNALRDLTGKVPYKIRMVGEPFQTKLNFPWIQLPGPDILNSRHYAQSGFTGLQTNLDMILLKLITGKEATHTLSLQPFPYPPYIMQINFQMFYFILLPQLICLGFIFIVPSIIRGVVNERETGIKELMKMMGLPNWMHWFGWMLNSMLILMISITIVVFLFFYPFNAEAGAVFMNSDPTMWWFVLFLYAMSSTAFCFFISSFFTKPTLATTFGIVIWLVSYYALAFPLENKYQSLNMFEKLSAALVPNMALYWAIKIMSAFELKAAGARWHNIAEPLSSIDPLTLEHICLMFVVNTVMYMALTLYVENILPSEYGVRKPWYYIFKPSTWCLTGKVTPSRPVSAISVNDVQPGFEQEPSGLTAGVEIQSLRKVFGKNKVAVDGVTVKMYDGEITALLGHNGAGKTTTMSMLTGMFAPTSGTAIINGHDIITDMEGVRQNLGLCPQHNMLFDKLTVAEHLQFFGRLKGLTSSEAAREAKELISKLKMGEKMNALSMSLSGGQKRRLSLANALIGGSKVVILDEPTSGLDPEARREVWNVLLAMRGERTIVLTTHFMEEADVLGDRIAIMADGKIQCSGTPMFLKKFYGAGYTLSMSINGKAEQELILLTVQKFVGNASFKSNRSANSSELAITLPTESASTSVYPEMFGELSKHKDRLGIEAIGLSLTTMDEVFVKVGELSHAHEDDELHFSHGTPESDAKNSNNNSSINSLYHKKLEGLSLIRQQFWSLIVKRFIYTMKKRKLVLCQLLMPVVSLIIAIVISNTTFEPLPNPPPLTMSLDKFKSIVTLYHSSDDDLSKAFESVAGPSAKQFRGNETMTLIDALTKVGVDQLAEYRERYIIAADLNATNMKALFSTIPYHSSAIAINVVTNTLLRSVATNSQSMIEVTNHPLKTGLASLLDAARPNPIFSQTVPLLFAIFLPLGLSLLAASYIVFPVEERLCQAKQLQMMTGVSPLVYWGSSFVWDFFVMAILVCVMLICFPIFQNYGVFTAYGGAGVVFLILIIYGFSAISFSYLCSLFVSTVPGGFALVTIIHVATGMLLCLVMYFLEFAQLFSEAGKVRHVGRFFPTFGACVSTMRFTEIASKNSRCNILSEAVKELICNPEIQFDESLRQCCANCMDFKVTEGSPCFQAASYITWMYDKSSLGDITGHPSQLPGVGQELLYLFLAGLGYKFLLIVLEYGILHKIINLVFKTSGAAFQANPSDADVIEEANRVQNLIKEGKNEDAVIVENLCKSYGSFAAVSNLSFGVHHGECFGLLGVNGAGKTTTFRMLTGDEIRSNGNAYALMYSLEKNNSQFLRNIGYCPQFDGIVGVLSGKEMLELFARLRGVHAMSIESEADKWLAKLGLSESANVQCQKYSGGMKRRLSAGMAMIGDPPIILLDEPTSGVDPISRRQFWKIISSVKEAGQAVILTSHSMEECEALCSRLGIMVNGQLQCLGGVQHLKNKFAQGYTLTIKLNSTVDYTDQLKALSGEVIIKFHPCTLKDQHQNVLKYQIHNTLISWEVLFKTMEDLKTQYEVIEEYSVSETTLEEIFLTFARKQYPNREANISLLKKLITCQCCK